MIINGKRVETGLDLITWKEDPRLAAHPSDGRARKTNWVRNIVIHTTKGIPGGSNKTPQEVIYGGQPKGKKFKVAKYFFTSARKAGAHFIIDTDGSIGQLADVYSWASYHATTMNEVSIGIEIYQNSDGSIYEASLHACVDLCKELCKHLGIQFQIHMPYKGPIRRLSVQGGKDVVGIVGHRDQTKKRGAGDPGHFIMEYLIDAGAEAFDFDKEEDLAVWKRRQEVLGIEADGIPGPATWEALKAAGYRDGLYAFGKPPKKSFLSALFSFFGSLFGKR